MTSFFVLLLPSVALSKKEKISLSEAELYELKNNKNKSYLYCDKNHSKMAELIAEISTFDKDQNSPVWQLHKHIQDGFCIGRQDAIVEALEHAEKTLAKNYQYLTNDKLAQIQTILNSVMDAINNGNLTVNMHSAFTAQHNESDSSLDENDKSFRDKKSQVTIAKSVKFAKDVKFKEDVKFEDHVKFEHFVKFDGNVKFGNTATFEEDVTIEGTLTVADEVIDCDLTVGCNINMNNSISSSVGNIFKNGNSFIHNFGNDNTFVGQNAGNFGMTGYDNSGFGVSALTSNTSGVLNTALGLAGLASNQDGSVNTAVGVAALANNISGEANTAVGFLAMVGNRSGTGNVAFGVETLGNNISGDNNTGIGAGALAFSTGSNNIALGNDAGSLLTSGNDNIYIGHEGGIVETGFIRIGTPLTHIEAYLQGVFGSSTGVGGLGVEVDATGKLGTIVSARKFKRNIEDMNVDSENIYQLRPVTFSYNIDDTDTKQYGLIAEEVADIYPSLIAHDRDGNPYSVRYQVLPVLLLNEVQKQHASIERQQASIQALTERVAYLEERA
jgi:hypothetical protein